MPYPASSVYKMTIGPSFKNTVFDRELKGGEVRLNGRGQPLSYAGGYSIVFPIEVGHQGKTFALRCWTTEISEVQDRYKKISAYLTKRNLPYFVECKYVPNGIRIQGEFYPTIRMEWVEGKNLCKFVEQNLGNSKIFKTVADKFAEMVKNLHCYRIAHGDLQAGNILLLQNGTDIEIKLIDYDSLYVPTLGNQLDKIAGLSEYQHPQRMAGGGKLKLNEKVDYFSELVIYLSFRSLAERPALWSQFVQNVDKRLIFSADDFENPTRSKVFQELVKMSPEVQQLASTLKKFCAEQSIDSLKPLEEVLPVGGSIPHPPKLKPKGSQTARDYYEQGLTYLRNDQPNYAVHEFKEAINLAPNYKKAYHDCGLAYFKMKQFKRAENAFEKVIEISPYDTKAQELLNAIRWNGRRCQKHYNTAKSFYDQRDFEKAKNEVEKALHIDPSYKPALDLLQTINNRVLPQPPKKTDHRDVHCNKARIFCNQNNLEKAKDEVEKALRIDPKYTDAKKVLQMIQRQYHKRAETYKKKRQYDKALVAYEEVIKIGRRLD